MTAQLRFAACSGFDFPAPPRVFLPPRLRGVEWLAARFAPGLSGGVSSVGVCVGSGVGWIRDGRV